MCLPGESWGRMVSGRPLRPGSPAFAGMTFKGHRAGGGFQVRCLNR